MSTWVFTKISIILISFAAGLLFFYVTSPDNKAVTKQKLSDMISLMINLVLFIWAGKILVNISLFVTDPLAVLAYPSDSKAFYVAVLLILLNIGYRVKRHHQDFQTILSVFTPVFLVSAFVFEFIDFAWNNNSLTLGHQGLLLILILFFLLMQEKLASIVMACIVFAGWSLGQLLFTYIMPYTTLFDYIMSRWFLWLVLVTSVLAFIYNRKRVAS